ncbi:MAG: thioredoxin domain-containing protein [Chitinophagaceae bacterium]|jgi:thioredoxin
MRIVSIFLVLTFSASMAFSQTAVADAEAFNKAISTGKVQVLDVRTADEYKSGHIDKSLQANWLDKKEFLDRTSHLDKSIPVYIYCLSGGRSAAAAEVLRANGYKVTNLEGGITAWKAKNKPLVGVSANAKQTSMSAYNGQIRSTRMVLVDFGAEWCPPCKKMEPVLTQFMKENGKSVTLVKMDGGIETELMKTLNVDALPTFILYKDGKEYKRKQGIVTKEEFTSWIN